MRTSLFMMLALAAVGALCAALSGADTLGYLVTEGASPLYAGPGAYYEMVAFAKSGSVIEVPQTAITSPRPWMPVRGFPKDREEFEKLVQSGGERRSELWVSVRNVKPRAEVNEHLYELALSPFELSETEASHALRGVGDWIASSPAGRAMTPEDLAHLLRMPFSANQMAAFRKARASAKPRQVARTKAMEEPKLDCLAGTQVALQVLRRLYERLEGEPVRHDGYECYLNLVAAYLAENTVCYDRRFRVILWENDELVGGFSTPGGYIVLTTGLLQSCHSEAELAGVLAHEMAHVYFEHGLQVGRYADEATGIIGLFDLESELDQAVVDTFGHVPEWRKENYQHLEDMAADFLEKTLLSQYLIADEQIADGFAAVALYNSGYPPQALGRLLSRLEAGTQAFLTNHGPVEDRLRVLNGIIQRVPLSNPAARTFGDEFIAAPGYSRGP